MLSPIASKVGVGFSSSSISKKEVNIGKLDKSKIACYLKSGGRKVRGKALLER